MSTPRAVVLGHSGDSTDADHLTALAEAGFWLGMDRFGINLEMSFEARADIVVELCRRGLAGRMVLSHDAACYIDWIDPEVLPMLPQWHYLHIDQDVLPYLRAHGVTEEQITAMLVDNPRRILAGALVGPARDGCARPDGQPPSPISAAWRSHSSGITAAGRSWAIPSTTHSSAPGTASAVARPPGGVTSGSAEPWTTRVGTATSARPVGPVRRGEDGGELADRPVRVVAPVVVPGGPSPYLRLVEGEPGRGEDPGHLDGLVDDGVPSLGRLHQEGAHGLGGGRPAAGPGVDMIDVRVRVRVGWSMANCWAIIPPMDTPSTCADPMPRASSRPAASAAMSASR